MIRIVHITTVPETLRFLTGQIGYMKAREFDPAVISSPGEHLGRFAAAEGVPCYPIFMSRQITPLRDLASLFKLLVRSRSLRPQVVHAHTPKGGLLGMLAAFLAGIPARVYHIHGLPYVTASGFRRALLRWCEKLCCSLAHRVFCVARSNAELVIAEGLCDERKIRVLLQGSINGVDAASRFNPSAAALSAELTPPRDLGIPPSAPVVGFVGRIVRDKGVQELFQAWQMLREEFPELHLLLAGPVEPQDPLPLETVEYLRGDHRVHMLDWVDDVVPIYARMDVLALPSHREGWGVVLLEAAALRVPGVATRIPGCVDAVVDGVTGTLVPPRDARALAQAIRIYLKDSELRRNHGQAARDRALRDFRPEALWNALYQEYLALLEEKKLRAPSRLSEESASANSMDGRKD